MSTKSLQTIETAHGTLTRLHALDRAEVGMTLYLINGTSGEVERLGTVVSAEKHPVGGNTTRCTLDNGEHMTRRGWQSRRLWRLA